MVPLRPPALPAALGALACALSSAPGAHAAAAPKEELKELRSRIEAALINANFNGLSDESGEFVSKGVLSEGIKGEMIQAGGPGSYDYHIKIRFQVETTKGVTP